MPTTVKGLLARNRYAPCGYSLAVGRAQFELIMEALELRLQSADLAPRTGVVEPMRDDWQQETAELYRKLDAVRAWRPPANHFSPKKEF